MRVTPRSHEQVSFIMFLHWKRYLVVILDMCLMPLAVCAWWQFLILLSLTHGLISPCGLMDIYDQQISLCFIFRLSLNTFSLGYIYWYIFTVFPQLSCLENSTPSIPNLALFPHKPLTADTISAHLLIFMCSLALLAAVATFSIGCAEVINEYQ